jgi:hypothetical protein
MVRVTEERMMTDPNYWIALIAAYHAGFFTVLSAYELAIRKNTTNSASG